LRKSTTVKPKNDPTQAPDLYHVLKNEVKPIRKQGEPPARDGTSFSRYACDLCNSVHPVQELRQCAICGRWACEGCWTKEYYLCNSCNGIVRLQLINKER